jgi:hypothetical protein
MFIYIIITACFHLFWSSSGIIYFKIKGMYYMNDQLFSVVLLAVFVWCITLMVHHVIWFTSIFPLFGKSGSYPSFRQQSLFWQ